MINRNDVKKFDCYGKGWLFNKYFTRQSVEKLNKMIDLTKFEWNKGYTLSFQHFGVLDPLFGDYESDSPWTDDANFVKYVLETTKKTDAWLNNESVKYLAEDLEIDNSKENLDILIDAGIDRDSSSYIRDILNTIGLGNEFAICGITDESYFTKLVETIGYDLADDITLNVEFLG